MHCPNQFIDEHSFKNHIENSLNIQYENYIGQYAEESVEINLHECEECGLGVNWDKAAIESHLKSDHKIGLSDYYEQNKNELEMPQFNITDETLLERYTGNFTLTAVHQQHAWANRCIYKCNICASQFKDARVEFKKHILTAHHMLMGDYTKEHGKSLEHEETHFCRLENCGSQIMWEQGSLNFHLKLMHNSMSLQDYQAKCLQNETEINSNRSTSSLYQASWANRCIYKCNICAMTFEKSRYEFERHMPTVHNITIGEYTKEHGKSMQHEEKHCCQVEHCVSKITWEKGYIANHLRTIHEISLQDYETKYMSTYKEIEVDVDWSNKCIFKCAVCQREFNSHSKFGSHLMGRHQQTITEYKEEHGKTVSYEERHSCQVESCSTLMMWDRSKIASHLRNVHDCMSIDDYKDKYMDNYVEKENPVNSKPFNTSISLQTFTWANRCLYKCNICQIDVNSKHSFEYHLRSKHSLLLSEYTRKFGKTMSHEERHSCQVENCTAFLRWDKTAIYNHIRDVHNKMSLEEYEKMYMKNYKEKNVEENLKTQTSQLDQDRYSESHYSCKICTPEQLFHSRGKAGNHMKTAHKINLKDYKDQYGASLSYRINHVCQMCAAVLVWDKDSIRSHLYGVHDKTPLEEYFNKYIDHFNDEDEWLNKVSFKCKECKENKFESNHRQRLLEHVQKEHKMNEMEYRILHGSMYGPELPESHTCQVCFVKMNWESISLKPHVEMKHGMTINEYVDTYKSNYQENDGIEVTNGTDSVDNEWANMCTFQCVVCQKIFNSRSKFGTHVKSQHQLSVTDYTKTYGRSVLHEEKHSCQVESCNAQMLWDRQTIKTHLTNVHSNVSIENYKDKYMDNYIEKEKSNGLNLSTNSDSQAQFSWANRCIYKCNICGMTFKNARYEFERHMPTVHNITVGDYTKEHGKTMEHEVKHSCQVENCNSKITWEKGYIMSHLYKVHNPMSLQEYEQKYMSNYTEKESNLPTNQPDSNWANRCVFKCALCETEVNNRGIFEYHLKSKHTLPVKEYMTKYGKTLSHEEFHSCQVDNCNSHIWWDRTSIKNHLYRAHEKLQVEEYEAKYMSNYAEKEVKPGSQQESNWANKCIFKCSLCDLEVNNKSSFEYHLKTKHNLLIKEYLARHGKTLSHEERHNCQIENCTCNILWDRTTIKSHLYNVHDKMSIEEYETNYMKNYKEIESSQTNGTNLSQDKYSECQFSCNICEPEKLFRSRGKVSTHMKSAHKINLQHYNATYGSSLSYQVNHICHICAGTVLWDKGAIRSHLYGVHDQMPLQEYFERYIDIFNENTEWLNKINFECKECSKLNGQFLTNNRTELWNHIGNTHKMNEMEYRTIHGSIYGPDPPLSHNCQVCQIQVNWESIALKPHIDLKHQMTVEQYVNKFKDTYEEKKPARETRLTLKRDRSGYEDEKSYCEDKKYVDGDDKIKTYDKKLPPVVLKKDPSGYVIKNEDSKDATSSNLKESSDPSGNASGSSNEEVLKWAAGCLYLCKVCAKSTPGLDQFKKHLVIRHKQEYKQYEKTYQAKDYILFAGFHICQICNKNVRHDREYLKNHMEEHGLTIRKYMNLHNPKPPKLHRWVLEMKKKA